MTVEGITIHSLPTVARLVRNKDIIFDIYVSL